MSVEKTEQRVSRVTELRRAVAVRRAALAELAGRSARRDEVSVACVQCGRVDTTIVYRLGRRHGRYWCRDCGAVAAVPDLAALVPARWAEPAPKAAAEVAEPAAVLAPVVAAWFAATNRKAAPVWDKAAYYQLHKRFDAAVLAASASGRVPDSLAGVDLAAHSGLPSVSSVVGQLHEFCYLADPVVAAIGGSADPDAVLARVVHARSWLASAARDACWLLARYQPDVWPDPDDVARAGAGLLDGSLSREDGSLLRQALFGTDGGPQLRLLLRPFTDDEVIAAADAYCTSQARPLRDAALAALS